MNWRFVDSGLCEPAYSVAADEAMAIARSKDSVPNTLHFYRRNRPTVSLGYFQKAGEALDLDFCRKNGISIVRRVTGGSAIYTDENHLIYGLAVDEKTVPTGREESMRLVCSAIVLALNELGVESSFKPANDILVEGRKISGSAQMRRWGIVLQHGTLILGNRPGMMQGALKMDEGKVRARGLAPSNYTVSLIEAMGVEPPLEKVKAALIHGFEEVFEISFDRQKFSEAEETRINELIEQKYGSDGWNLRL